MDECTHVVLRLIDSSWNDYTGCPRKKCPLVIENYV